MTVDSFHGDVKIANIRLTLLVYLSFCLYLCMCMCMCMYICVYVCACAGCARSRSPCRRAPTWACARPSCPTRRATARPSSPGVGSPSAARKEGTGASRMVGGRNPHPLARSAPSSHSSLFHSSALSSLTLTLSHLCYQRSPLVLHPYATISQPSTLNPLALMITGVDWVKQTSRRRLRG